LGLAVTMAVSAVGTPLLFALGVTPAAAAIIVTPRPGVAIAVSAVISVGAVGGGLGLSAMFNAPPRFVVVTSACGVGLLVWVVSRTMRPTWRPALRSSAAARRR